MPAYVAESARSIAVTGASGFIGRHAVSAFESAGLQVRALSRAAGGPRFGSLDYLDGDAVARAIDGVNAVVHVAGLAHVSARQLSDPRRAYDEANVRAAVSVAGACVKTGVQSMVLLSSAGVLGKESPEGGFDDRSGPDPYDLYTISKLEGERRVSELAVGTGLAVAILRPPMVYGPDAPGSFRRLCTWIEHGWPLPLGRVVKRRSFVGIRNLCDAMRASAVARMAGITTMLVADSAAITAAEFARQIAKVRGRRAHFLPVPPWALKAGFGAIGLMDSYRRVGGAFELHPSRLRELLGWNPPYTLTDELSWSFLQQVSYAAAPGRQPRAS